MWFWWAAAAALVDIAQLNPAITLDMRYATAANFTHQRLYAEARCLLTEGTAKRIDAVARDVAAQGLRLQIYDCYRPLAVQRLMWKLVPDSRYVANPSTGSRHNRGASVDLTLTDAEGHPLAMGSNFDDFSVRAWFANDQLSTVERRNRETLRRAMTRRGFLPLDTEWWHFDDPDWRHYPLLDVPLRVSGRP